MCVCVYVCVYIESVCTHNLELENSNFGSEWGKKVRVIVIIQTIALSKLRPQIFQENLWPIFVVIAGNRCYAASSMRHATGPFSNLSCKSFYTNRI